MNFFKTSELEMGERLIRRGTKDRCIIFIVTGEFLKFSDPGQPNIEYKEGAVVGVEEFLKNREWPQDIICSQGGIVCKFTEESLLDMINT